VVAGVAGFRSVAVRENFFHILARHRVTYFSAVPTIYASLLQLPVPTMDLSHVKFCISGAAALPTDVMLRFQEVTGIRLLEGYGQTEATVGTCLTPFHALSKPGSIGRPLPYVKVRVVREDDGRLRTCEEDEIGELLTCGDHVTLGYLNSADETKLWLNDDTGTRWLKTGDLARIDRDGYVWLTGRSKELIIRGGHNIDPKMIEDAMRLHPAVVDAAAVGQPHPRLGEMPVVYVRTAAVEVTEDELLSHAKQSIPERAAWPSQVRIVPELPLTAIGKVFKPRLIEQERDFVFSQALADLRHRLISGRIETRADTLHGSLSVFTLSPKPGETAEFIRRHIEAFMAPFPVKYRIDIA
jgi:fatty-acyl-CoA synthase